MTKSNLLPAYILVILLSAYSWWGVAVNKDFKQGMIFCVGSLIVLAAYAMDKLFPSRKTKGHLDIMDLPVNMPPETSEPETVLGKKLSGPAFDLLLGVGLLLAFLKLTMVYGISFVGMPAVTFAATRTGQAAWTAAVFACENGVSSMMSFTSASVLADKVDVTLSKILGAVAGAAGMVILHNAVYGLSAPMMTTVFIFFLVGNLVTAWRGNQVAFGVQHAGYNYIIAASSLNVALGMVLASVTGGLA